MRRLMRAAFPPDGREGVTVSPGDLKAVLRLVKRFKNRTPADGCVVCHHKDREHRGDGACMAPLESFMLPAHPDAGTLLCKCDAFVPVADVPFDVKTKCPACEGTGKCPACDGKEGGCWACGMGSKPGVCETCRGKKVATDG
jgi:hypothetical protein